jgi:hypothetical protein
MPQPLNCRSPKLKHLTTGSERVHPVRLPERFRPAETDLRNALRGERGGPVASALVLLADRSASPLVAYASRRRTGADDR